MPAPMHPQSNTDLREVVAAMSAALARPHADGHLPTIFEQHLQRLLAVRTVRLREIPSRYQARLVTPTRTGEFAVVCAELCGLGHATMRAKARVVTQAEFDKWIEEQRS